MKIKSKLNSKLSESDSFEFLLRFGRVPWQVLGSPRLMLRGRRSKNVAAWPNPLPDIEVQCIEFGKNANFEFQVELAPV